MIDTTIYYFTGTGNSLFIAKSLGEQIENCELVPIAKIWQDEDLKSTSGRIGFIYPLYYSGLPKIVYDFISKIDLSKSDYFFSAVTNAGDVTDLPLQQVAKLLQEKSKFLNAGFLITMPNNYIIGFDVHPEARQKEFFENANSQMNEIIKIVKLKESNISKDIFEKDLSRADKFNSKFRDNVYESDKHFYTDENCSSCGLCEEICPMNNITIEQGRPQWQHRCQQCLACINFCPEKSIQIGKSTLKTQRYHHPEITVEDIKELTKAGTGCGGCIKNIEEILSVACGCKMVSMEAVLNAVKNGANTVEDVSEITGAGDRCGKCKMLIKNVIDTKK